MQRKNKSFFTLIVLLCVLFAFVLVFSEAFASEHDCMGEHCVVCALCAGAKFVFALTICALTLVACIKIVPRSECGYTVRQTPVSIKAKLTI